jgi:Ni/Fe-hydrogenase subunit HybB-like protein
MKLRLTKTILWFFAGLGLTVVVLRILHGLGSVVALTDVLPWGLWKGGGVVALVPIGGAGFTLAAFVYIFHWKRYEVLARGAVLLGLVCYTSVAVGLTFDIGIWWRIVFPVIFWQLHSTLFEIAWCIMLYLGVLVLEFSHVVLERLNFPRLLAAVKKVSIVFVILGIALSTLHQSSLGTLFLATPYRLHPLWYSELLPLLFFITAVGLGCLTISWIALVVHWLYGAKQPMEAVSGLARISSIVLGVYVLIRFGDLLLAGKGALLLTLSWDTANFWLELALSALIPVALMTRRKLRESPAAMLWISSAAIIGMSLNRVNVAGVATLSTTEGTYFPIWPEWAATFGILSLAGLFFLFCVERFKVFKAIDAETLERAYSGGKHSLADWKSLFFDNPLASVRLYSAATLVAVGIAAGCLPESAVLGVSPEQTPTQGPQRVQIQKIPAAQGGIARYAFPVDPAVPAAGLDSALLLDGDDNGRYVLFQHRAHIQRLRQRQGQGFTCSSCHHMNHPFSQATSCASCHTDMYLAREIFDHQGHVEQLGGNQGCVRCHTDPALPKVRANTTPCESCHPKMRAPKTLVKTAGVKSSQAPGYRDAMHKLCISCHKQEQATRPQGEPSSPKLDGCTTCHSGSPTLTSAVKRLQGAQQRREKADDGR